MCFDTTSSLLAWSLAYSISWYLFNRNQNYDRWNAGFILCFTTIQLLEAGIWSSPSKSINGLLTCLVLLVLASQPLMQSYLGYKSTGNTILLIMTFVVLAIFLWFTCRVATSKPGQFSSTPGANGHLIWKDTESSNIMLNTPITLAYLGGLLIPLLFMKNGKGLPLIGIGVATAIYSLYFAGPKEFGSYWCFTSVAYAVVALFV